MFRNLSSKVYLLSFLLITFATFAQVGINNTSPNSDALLEIGNATTTTKGLILPRVDLTGTSNAAPLSGHHLGMIVYNKNTSGDVTPGFYFNTGTAWYRITAAGVEDWSTTGNSGTSPGTNFIGTTDNQDLAFYTNNNEQMRILANGFVGINTTSADEYLDVNGDIDIGGGSGSYDNEGENLLIRAQSEEWYLSIVNDATAANSDFFVGTSSDPSDSDFRVTPAGLVSIGSDDDNPDDILHVTDDQNATTAIRIDNTNSGSYGVSTALNLYDGGSLEAFFRHNNNTDVLELGNNDTDDTVEFYADGGVVMTMDANSDVNVINNLSKGGGSFKIDHPLDPENKYLYHSFVESPDMMNVYNGNIKTNSNGEATIVLPDYFSALNKDYRYQLTTIGSFAKTMISKELSNNSFKIKSDLPNVKVSWQITGIRKDPYANENRIIPEVEKESHLKGKYLHPSAYSLTKKSSIYYNKENTQLADEENLEKEDFDKK